MRSPAVLLAVIVLAGCTSDPAAPSPAALSPQPSPPATSPSTSPPSSPAPAPAPPPPAAQACTAPVFSPATPVPGNAAASGGILGMASIATGPQPDFDRVVFTLAGGSATPGWDVSYTANPTSDGSGDPVAVQGAAFLQVIVKDVGYPGDTGVPDPAVKVLTPTNTTVVEQVRLDTVFEGQYTAFIGLDAARPVKVFTLAGPPRVVVDVAHC